LRVTSEEAERVCVEPMLDAMILRHVWRPSQMAGAWAGVAGRAGARPMLISRSLEQV